MALRGLVSQVLLFPGEKRGEMRAELRGEIAALLALGTNTQQKARPSFDERASDRDPGALRVSLVAGTGFEPVTFRL